MPSDPLEGKADLLSQLDPDKIYVENVRSVLDVSHRTAQAICETATRRGLFKRQVEVMCPDGSVAAIAEAEDALPETVRCVVEQDGQPEEEEISTSTLHKSIFYKLNETSTVAHA